jgi:hypothetical protein
MPDAELHDTVTPSRRGFLRLVGASTATAAVAGTSLHHSSQPAAAFADELWEGVTQSNPMLGVAEYLVRSVSDFVTGPDVSDLDNYVGHDAQLDALYERALGMQSANDRVFTLIRNRLADSKNSCYSKAKIRIAEELNAGSTKADVKSVATAVVDDYYETVQTNFLSHWNEMIVKLDNMFNVLSTNSNVDLSIPEGMFFRYSGNQYDVTAWSLHEGSITLVGGTSATVKGLGDASSYAGDDKLQDLWFQTLKPSQSGSTEAFLTFEDSNANEVQLYNTSLAEGMVRRDVPRIDLWELIIETHSEMVNNVQSLVEQTYDAYQSGDITTDDLIDASTFASQLAAEESDDSAYAMADLVALGVSTNLDGTGKVRLEDSEVTVEGVLGYTEDTGFSVGTTYYPTNEAESNYLSGDVYFAYDGDSGEGTLALSDYRGNLDGGIFRLLVAPVPNTTYSVTTVNDETATATAPDFTETTDGSGNTVWEVDLSGQLNEPIADISTVKLYAAEGATNNGLVQITEPFTILEYTNGDGSSVDSVNVQSYNHQTSDSLTAEELGQLRAALEEYNNRDTSDGGSGGGGSSTNSGFLSGEWMGVPKAGWLLGGTGVSLLGYEFMSDDDDDYSRRGGGRY